MGASLSILLTVLAQAAAPAAPAAPACNPPCAAGQYCAPNGQCYVPAPPPAPAPPPPAQAPGAYAPAQNPPPPTSYPPAQGAPPPAYYPPPQNAPPPGYYAQPQQQGYPQQQQPAYPQSTGYPPGAYGSPPPGVYQPQVVPVRQSEPYKEGPRFGLFLGGLVVADVQAAAGGAMLTFGSKHHGFETRIYGAFYKVEDEDTKTTGTAAFVHGTRWWGVYGLGFGSGLGYADFNPKTIYGWSDSSAQVLAYIAPVMLRFGRQPTFELGLNSGATVIFSHDVRPYGYLYGAILF